MRRSKTRGLAHDSSNTLPGLLAAGAVHSGWLSYRATGEAPRADARGAGEAPEIGAAASAAGLLVMVARVPWLGCAPVVADGLAAVTEGLTIAR